jgi:hypothetical protein
LTGREAFVKNEEAVAQIALVSTIYSLYKNGRFADILYFYSFAWTGTMRRTSQAEKSKDRFGQSKLCLKSIKARKKDYEPNSHNYYRKA